MQGAACDVRQRNSGLTSDPASLRHGDMVCVDDCTHPCCNERRAQDSCKCLCLSEGHGLVTGQLLLWCVSTDQGNSGIGMAHRPCLEEGRFGCVIDVVWKEGIMDVLYMCAGVLSGLQLLRIFIDVCTIFKSHEQAVTIKTARASHCL